MSENYEDQVFARTLLANIRAKFRLLNTIHVESDQESAEVGDVFVVKHERVDGPDYHVYTRADREASRGPVEEVGTATGAPLKRDRVVRTSTPITLEAAFKQVQIRWDELIAAGINQSSVLQQIVNGVARNYEDKVKAVLAGAALAGTTTTLATAEDLLAALFDNQSELTQNGVEDEGIFHAVSSDIARAARGSKDFRDFTLRGDNTVFRNGDLGFVAGGTLLEVPSLPPFSLVSYQTEGIYLANRAVMNSSVSRSGVAFEDSNTATVGFRVDPDSTVAGDILTAGALAGAAIVDPLRVVARKGA